MSLIDDPLEESDNIVHYDKRSDMFSYQLVLT
jgi:hypothetical protein